LFFVAVVFFGVGLFMGCHTGPSYREDSGYRAIEREADRNSADLAITGANIAAGVERINDQAERVESELDSLEAAIGGSSLADPEKCSLLRQVAVVQEEAAALRYEVGTLREDARRHTVQLEEQRSISAALSEEHDKREAARAEVKEDLAVTREKLAKVSGQRNLAIAIAAALALAVIGYIVIRVLRFLRIIPV
jgi:chromosome segregation ATPase